MSGSAAKDFGEISGPAFCFAGTVSEISVCHAFVPEGSSTHDPPRANWLYGLSEALWKSPAPRDRSAKRVTARAKGKHKAGEGRVQKKEPGRSAEGAEAPRLVLPASAVSEQEIGENQTLSSLLRVQLAGLPRGHPRRWNGLLLIVSAQEFVAFDSCHYADGGIVARLGTLHTAEAAHTHRSGHGDFVRQR